MASVTARPPDDPGLARVGPETIALSLPSAPTTVRIEPPRGWLELHLKEVWQSHEIPLFFGHLARLPSDGLPYPVFYFAALVPWTYFSTALQSCTGVVVGNQHLITKVYFPRLVLPL